MGRKKYREMEHRDKLNTKINKALNSITGEDLMDIIKLHKSILQDTNESVQYRIGSANKLWDIASRGIKHFESVIAVKEEEAGVEKGSTAKAVKQSAKVSQVEDDYEEDDSPEIVVPMYKQN